MNPFLLDVTNGVATVTLNRPERLNALLWESYAGLRDFFGGIKKDRSIRAIVLTAFPLLVPARHAGYYNQRCPWKHSL
jgi:enoyl-CoA hydratase/carnithine racemase